MDTFIELNTHINVVLKCVGSGPGAPRDGCAPGSYVVPPRFFFDVSNGKEIIPDQVGVEAASLDEVLAEARVVIAEMAYGVIEADPNASWTLIVRDEAGSSVGRLPVKR